MTMRRRRTNIEPRIIRGDDEFFHAWGFPASKISEFRSKGMPSYFDNKQYFYYPEEIDAWLREQCRIVLPSIKTT